MQLQRQSKKTLSTVLRHRVTLNMQNDAADGEGGFTENYATVRTCWASIEPIKAVQQYDYQSIGVDATHLIKIRGSIMVDEKKYKIIFGNRSFEVLTVENIQERGVYSVITCKEVR